MVLGALYTVSAIGQTTLGLRLQVRWCEICRSLPMPEVVGQEQLLGKSFREGSVLKSPTRYWLPAYLILSGF